MEMNHLRYPVVLFDWGDTVMRDDAASAAPMVEWPKVEAVEGIADLLKELYASGRQMILATNAAVSDENEIRDALARVELASYFSHIFCFQNTQLPKGEVFYRHILSDLDVPAADVLMVGDSFEKDVLAANDAGIFAVWFNPVTDEVRSDEQHVTVQSMRELSSFFKSFE